MVDALRGFAVLAILLVHNIEHFIFPVYPTDVPQAKFVEQHHFYGAASSTLNPVNVEINVEEGIDGFCMELWSYAPELVRVVVQSPTGQRSKGGFPVAEETQTTNFVFENTRLTLDYRIAGKESGDLLIFS